MKKFISVGVLAAILSVSASAQLRVVNSGQVQIGSCSSSTSSSSTIISNPSVLSKTDTLATFRLIGDNYMESGARIAFGNRKEVSISESVITPKGNSITQGQLLLKGAGGFQIASAKNGLFSSVINFDPASYSINSSVPTLNISAPISAPQYLTVSDSRSKTDIEPLEEVGALLSQIVPVSYHLIDNNGDSQDSNNAPRRAAEANSDSDSGNVTSSNPVQFGFLAQDVREVYPELVFEDPEGNLSIDYLGFIPILVDAIQNLQATVAEQAEQINSLQNPQNGPQNAPGRSMVATLSQNHPNPFRSSTEINCFIPETSSVAYICVYDLNGNQKLKLDIKERGEVVVTIEGNRLNAGMYIYTLIVDGAEVDSKRMILTD